MTQPLASRTDVRTTPQLPSDNDLVIGEGVVLDLQPTSFATRLVGALIDYTVLIVLLIASVFLLISLLLVLDPAASSALMLLVWVGILVGVPVLIETLTRGRSLGKLALGLRVVRDDGGPIRLRHSVIRALLALFEVWMLTGAGAVICSLANSRGKRIGDLLAGTYVVRERGYRPPQLYLSVPAQLRGWAQSADIVRLPDDLAMATRQFLMRAQLMAPHARAGLARELADEVRTRVAPPPPPGTPPEDFLAAVLAERRDRELARLQREQQAAGRRAAALHRLPYGR